MELKLLTNLAVTIKFPWPVLTQGIETSLTSGNLIQIVAKKCVDDSLLGEYGGCSKCDINYLKPWKQITSHGHLRQHMEAQFSCADFSLMKRFSITVNPLSPLDQVRDIDRAVFYSHYNNSFQLMAVHEVENPEDPVFFIRIHPPVRFSPHGSPLLLVSVIDYPRLEELIAEGKVDREAFQAEFHRIVTEGVSKEVCVIRASTSEEVNLLRYVLRVNSTKMRRSAWQSKNLPRGEDTPWIATFISPLYQQWLVNNCNQSEDDNHSSSYLIPPHPKYRKSCAVCYVTKVPLKRCLGCRRQFYCSATCQKNHWLMHKSNVSLSPRLNH